jgi:hypothetical protein
MEGEPIRKRRIALLILSATAMLLLSPAERVGALEQYEWHYTVWYNNELQPCMIGPPHPPSIEGEWVKDCYGYMFGWGWKPDDPCAYPVRTQGRECTPIN